MPIDSDGNPTGGSNPGQVELYVDGAPVSAANPLPISIGGGGAIPTWVSVPASAGASGTAGQMAYNGFYLFVCVASNTWKRVALGSW
jgi:hypothetical protein